MWFRFRGEDLGFRERAPVVHACEMELSAPRGAVFAAFIDPISWPSWFPNVRAARYTGPPPHGVGTIRVAQVGATRWEERIIAWDEGTCWAWTVTGASVPLASAQVESFEFTDAADGTRVRWTLALEPRLLWRIGARAAPRVLSGTLRRAMSNLETYLQRGTSP